MITGGLFNKTKLDYLFLKRLSPKHELLKYFSLDEQGFNIKPDEEIIEEFLKKFRGDIIPQELAIERRIPFAIYKYILISSVFGNYAKSLEDAIQSAEMMN